VLSIGATVAGCPKALVAPKPINIAVINALIISLLEYSNLETIGMSLIICLLTQSARGLTPSASIAGSAEAVLIQL